MHQPSGIVCGFSAILLHSQFVAKAMPVIAMSSVIKWPRFVICCRLFFGLGGFRLEKQKWLDMLLTRDAWLMWAEDIFGPSSGLAVLSDMREQLISGTASLLATLRP